MFICPVCGYDKLSEKPYDDDGNPSYEICSCCGFEFGFDDSNESRNYEDYRNKWIKQGAYWFSIKAKPVDWNLKEQLESIGVNI